MDLSGHSGGNRLPVFAREPAPVQITAWGYAASTGLDTMHYFLADPIVVPPDALAGYSEEVVSLPSVLCYEPPPYAPDVSALPAGARGYVTFGAFNRLPKISDETVSTWGRVLAAVPTARLVVKCGGADVSPERERLLDRLAAVGVSPERVTLLGCDTPPRSPGCPRRDRPDAGHLPAERRDHHAGRPADGRAGRDAAGPAGRRGASRRRC